MRESIFLKGPLILWREIATEKGLGEMRRLSDGGPYRRERGHAPGLCAWSYGWAEDTDLSGRWDVLGKGEDDPRVEGGVVYQEGSACGGGCRSWVLADGETLTYNRMCLDLGLGSGGPRNLGVITNNWPYIP